MRTGWLSAALMALPALGAAAVESYVVGDWRVQPLSPTLVRIEKRGPQGFEDRLTFTVVDRAWNGVHAEVKPSANFTDVITPTFTVRIPKGEGRVQVLGKGGKLAYELKEVPGPSYIPAPSAKFNSFAIADTPRLVPPAWGATPAPVGSGADPQNSGWDSTNNATDLYVFVTSDYKTLRKDYLKLTGPTPMPPLYTFGFIDSRWYPYTEKQALDAIDTYRKKQIPLDIFVCDTDWRVGASFGYGVNKKLFPDMPGFLAKAHEKGVRLMFNDHPEPFDKFATSEKELVSRYEGLTSLFEMGMDVWWFDRNWSTSLHEPMPGIAKEVWGMRLFTDITAKFFPDRRPIMMSNVQGVDNGFRNYPSHPAAHRFPIWWTGDTGSTWDYLKKGVENGVDLGAIAMLPYVNEDLGGHTGSPEPELYTRFLQFGCFSPVTRIHCTYMKTRYPWEIGGGAETIVPEYIRLRYRLLPTIYAASRKAYEDGTPLLRRCDLEWPNAKEATDPTQYLFGDDILVAPVIESKLGTMESVPASLFKTPNGESGLQGDYFLGMKLMGEPKLRRIDKSVDFNWERGTPGDGMPADNFSVRWTGKIGPMPESGVYTFGVKSDDGARLFIDGKQVVNGWKDQADVVNTGTVKLQKGQVVDIMVEYYENGGEAVCELAWVKPSDAKPEAMRTLWVPPGQWEDAWTGELVKGPKKVTVASPMWHMPMFVRRGGIVLSAPLMQHTGEKPWSPITIDAYATASTATTRTLYEDDGLSPEYLKKAYAKTPVILKRTAKGIKLEIAAAKGSFKGMLSERAWVARIHLLPGEKLKSVKLDGKVVIPKVLKPEADATKMPFRGEGSRPGPKAGVIVEVKVPARSVRKSTTLEVAL